MGPEKLLVLAALLSLEACSVLCYCTQPRLPASIIQTTPQLVVPSIKPIMEPCETYCAPIVTPSYTPAIVSPMPPIIIEDGNDNWQTLFYCLLFTMKNKNGGNGCCCGCGGNCHGDWPWPLDYGSYPSGFRDHKRGIPYPVPVPVNGPYGYPFPIPYLEDSTTNLNPNEINLIISTDLS